MITLGDKNMTCKDLADWVNEVLELEGEDKYCEGVPKIGQIRTQNLHFIIYIRNDAQLAPSLWVQGHRDKEGLLF